MRGPLSLLLGLGLTTLVGCMPPPNPMQRLNDTAFEMNTATRFGRMDIAMGNVSNKAQADFARRHRKWGKDIRVLDLELNGMQMIDETHAQVEITITWHHIAQSELRNTSLAQKWELGEQNWELVDERRTGGSRGLFHKPKRKRRNKKKASTKVGAASPVDALSGF